MKEKYLKYSVDELSCDDRFITWVQTQSKAHPDEWYVEGNELFNEKVDKAKALVEAIYDLRDKEDNHYVKEVWSNIESIINQDTNKKGGLRSIWKYVGGVAALLVVVFGVYLYMMPNDQWVTVHNMNEDDQTILLSDNSRIVLKPKSVVRYPKVFESTRNVELEGEAFFDVAKDKSRPFMIYAQNTITKVLGTSFTISAFKNRNEVSVDVHTGKVEVYSVDGKGIQNHIVELDEESEKVFLTPNQKAIFNKNQMDLQKTVMEVPRKLSTEFRDFKFVNKPLEEVFLEIEKIYGIDIQYDKKSLSNCTISTQLDDLPLPIKLKMITKALGLSLKEKNAVFYVNGNGC